MTLYNKIFGKKSSVSQEEIEKYISGDLSEKEKYEIELKAQSSDLDYDAIESFEKNPDKLNEFKKIKSDVSNKTFKSSIKLKYFIITGIAATITIFFIIYADIFNKKNNEILIAENTIVGQTSKPGKEKSKELFFEETEVKTQETKAEEIDKTSNKELKSVEENQIKKNYNTQIEKIKQKETEPMINIDSINTKKLIFAYNSPIKHLAHYKIVDYSFYKRENQMKKENNLGLDARFSNEKEKSRKETLSDKDLNLSYFSFLEKAMYKYDKKEYTNAIYMYNTILEQYPNDLNAFFYKGMSYYQLKKYEKSIKYLNKTIESEINIFHQEAEYYKALSLLHTNKKEGIKLLQKIADDALFYSQKAMIKLNETNE